tara:strand:- start:300 stop:1010 length:711 start_codon:yes stop_codon:yes gene_type:complete
MNIINRRIIKNFDKNMFNFKEVFIDHFKKFDCQNLEQAHEYLPKDYLPKEIVKVKNDQHQKIYDFLYKIDKGFNLKKRDESSSFLKSFDKFIFFLANDIFKESLVYQARPTLRIMFPNNKAVGDFHRDREYNHPIEEINIWVPITKSNNTNTIWIESNFDKNDYSPMNLEYGQFLIFDSGLKHGNKINLENKTRMSFDFRIIPYSIWQKKSIKENKVSADSKMSFEIGDYYKLMEI